MDSQGELPEGIHAVTLAEVMIANDAELAASQERIAYFQGLLAQFRIAATPEEFPAMASGYRAEIERMQKEVLEYLTRHASSSIQAEAV